MIPREPVVRKTDRWSPGCRALLPISGNFQRVSPKVARYVLCVAEMGVGDIVLQPILAVYRFTESP